ncbi:chemotaxis response regulator protein-glutamate methylesterase [Nocardioides fonticola]|uniref:Protein-glutamate methylesterase/protein-glutamine glutaminase n=1 Tax=Nocardioides fonticola TaxID=450363 RepID=A0ABP7XCP4_9ACTN
MIRALVVDDSAVLRRLITTVLSSDPGIEVVGTATNGREAIARVDELRPDIVTLDIEMPELDGLGAVEIIHRNHPRLPVIMFSTLTEKGAAATLQALSRGASDYVTKPSGAGSVHESMARVREELVPRIKALTGTRRMVPQAPPPVRRRLAGELARPQVLVIACSTGGPDALCTVLSNLPATFPLPVLVTQHMPPVFSTQLAHRLDRLSPLAVREAADGDAVLPGTVLLAPGDYHLRLARDGVAVRARLDQGEKENFCRPAADPLFRSAAQVYGRSALAVVLTGMGQDGLLGSRAVSEAGGYVITQDQESSVVWGMPGAVAGAGIADEILPLDTVASRLISVATRQARVPLRT